MSETDHTIISADLGSLRNMDKSCLYRIRLKKFVCWLKEFEVYIISRVDFLFDDQWPTRRWFLVGTGTVVWVLLSGCYLVKTWCWQALCKINSNCARSVEKTSHVTLLSLYTQKMTTTTKYVQVFIDLNDDMQFVIVIVVLHVVIRWCFCLFIYK